MEKGSGYNTFLLICRSVDAKYFDKQAYVDKMRVLFNAELESQFSKCIKDLDNKQEQGVYDGIVKAWEMLFYKKKKFMSFNERLKKTIC